MCVLFFFFFFQAEDGIRVLTVTGVQPCALPISRRRSARSASPWVEEVDPVFPIEACRRDPRVRQPVVGDVVEHVVDRESVGEGKGGGSGGGRINEKRR